MLDMNFKTKISQVKYIQVLFSWVSHAGNFMNFFSISLPINASCLYNMVLALTGSYWGWHRSDGWRNGTTYLCTTDRGGNRGVDGRRKTAPASASSPGVCQIRIIHLTFLRLESQRTDFWTFWTDGVYIMWNIIPVLKGKDSYVKCD